jgi:hypothetical protein
MSGLRPWDIRVYRQVRGAPMFSLGVHIDLHTPTIDVHLPFYTIQVGRNHWEQDGRRFAYLDEPDRWNGHSDNCDRPWTPEAVDIAAEYNAALRANADAAAPAPERIADANGDELEHGEPDFPGQFDAAPPAPEPGDLPSPEFTSVERLARALFEAERPGDWPTWDDYVGAFGSPGIAPWRRKAERIVSAYAEEKQPERADLNVSAYVDPSLIGTEYEASTHD